MRLLLLILFAIATNCHGGSSGPCQNKSFYIDSTNCVFDYRICQSSIFQFFRCTYTDTSNSIISSINKQKCIESCCTNKIYQLSSEEDIQNCKIQSSKQSSNSSQNSSSSSWLSIFFYVLGSTGGLLLSIMAVTILYICYLRHKKVSSRKVDSALGKAEQITNEDIKSMQQFQNVKQVGNDDTCCSICLQTGVNCAIPCSHKFHLKCILGWINRKETCPLCQRDNLHQFRYYCQKCKKNYITLESKNPKKKAEISRLLNKSAKFICKPCKKREKCQLQQIQ